MSALLGLREKAHTPRSHVTRSSCNPASKPENQARCEHQTSVVRCRQFCPLVQADEKGAQGRNGTADLLHTEQVLFLSYLGTARVCAKKR